MRSISRLVAAAAILTTSTSAWAALPPQYQRANELRAILENVEVVDRFGATRLIDGIEFVEPDLYRVTSGPCRMEVRIVDKPLQENIVGPRQFEVVPGDVVCE